MRKEPSNYERQAWQMLRAWKDPGPGKLEKALGLLTMPASKAAEVASLVPGLDWAMGKSVSLLTRVLNDLAHWSVRREAIYAAYRKKGYAVHEAQDVFTLDLKEVDRVVGNLPAKYVALAGSEGLAAGVAGIIGVPADVAALITLNLRAIGELATYYGFDVSRPEERLFALNLLFLASSPTPRAKRAALGQVVGLARALSARQTMRYINTNALGQLIQQFARILGRRLTRVKASQFLPLAGGVLAGSANVVYTRKVCHAASHLYRERFLAQKYGPEMLAPAAESTAEVPTREVSAEPRR